MCEVCQDFYENDEHARLLVDEIRSLVSFEVPESMVERHASYGLPLPDSEGDFAWMIYTAMKYCAHWLAGFSIVKGSPVYPSDVLDAAARELQQAQSLATMIFPDSDEQVASGSLSEFLQQAMRNREN